MKVKFKKKRVKRSKFEEILIRPQGRQNFPRKAQTTLTKCFVYKLSTKLGGREEDGVFSVKMKLGGLTPCFSGREFTQ